MIREIIKHPDPVLYKKCHAVTKFDARLGKILDDMADTLYKANGVGLAAPQIGFLKRIVVIDILDGNGLIEMINPKILACSGEQTGPEGCLSVPGFQGTVTRPNSVTVLFQDRNGETRQMTGSELFARAVCHELDHLDGKLYIDIAKNLEAVQPEEEDK